MPEYPHKAILDREKHASDAQEHFADQHEMLRQLANYGSNLVISCYVSSPEKLEDAILNSILLKQVVLMVDAFEVLVSQGCTEAAALQARAAFEASVYIDWILLSDAEKKAVSYYVANIRRNRLWAERATEGTAAQQEFIEDLGEFGEYLSNAHAEHAESITDDLEKMQEFLDTEPYKTANDELDRVRGRGRWDKAWYVPFGPQSFRQVVIEVGRLHEYDIFYSAMSETMHGSNLKSHAIFEGGQMKFRSVRLLEGAGTLISFVAGVAIRTYKAILGQYRPGQLNEFDRRYVAEWRDAFLIMKKVTYTSDHK